MIKIKEYLKPTVIYITGSHFRPDEQEDFGVMVTDDYCAVQVTGNIDTTFIETDGGFSILTEEQFKFDVENNFTEDEDGLEYVEIRDFQGEISILLEDDNGQNFLRSDVDFKECIMYQKTEDAPEGWLEPTVYLKGTYSSFIVRQYSDLVEE